MGDLSQEDQINVIQNQIHQWKITQFDAIIARRVWTKLGEPNTQADAIILRAEKALAHLEEELSELKKVESEK
jgi:hypothetical protein